MLRMMKISRSAITPTICKALIKYYDRIWRTFAAKIFSMRFLTISKDSKICSFTAKWHKIEISNQNTTLFVAQAKPECKYRYKKWSLWSEELLRLTMNSTMKLYYLHHIEESSSRCISLHLRKLPDHADPWIRVKYRPSTLHELNSNRKSCLRPLGSNLVVPEESFFLHNVGLFPSANYWTVALFFNTSHHSKLYAD